MQCWPQMLNDTAMMKLLEWPTSSLQETGAHLHTGPDWDRVNRRRSAVHFTSRRPSFKLTSASSGSPAFLSSSATSSCQTIRLEASLEREVVMVWNIGLGWNKAGRSLEGRPRSCWQSITTLRRPQDLQATWRLPKRSLSPSPSI
jgi:hypothetical protein